MYVHVHVYTCTSVHVPSLGTCPADKVLCFFMAESRLLLLIYLEDRGRPFSSLLIVTPKKRNGKEKDREGEGGKEGGREGGREGVREREGERERNRKTHTYMYM